MLFSFLLRVSEGRAVATSAWPVVHAWGDLAPPGVEALDCDDLAGVPPGGTTLWK